MTQFIVATDASVEVTFTVIPTTAAPVTTAVIDAAVADITAALSGYTVTPMAAAEAVIDGECASRCGLGCALCAQGEACSTDGDCAEGYCGAAGLCGVDSPTDNAAPMVSVYFSVFSVLMAALLM